MERCNNFAFISCVITQGETYRSNKMTLSLTQRAYLVYVDPKTGVLKSANKYVFTGPTANSVNKYTTTDLVERGGGWKTV